MTASLDSASATPRVAMVLTSHGKLGDTGRPTGFYLSEVSQPYEVFVAAGWEVDFVSPKGGRPPMDGADDESSASRAFLANEKVMAKVSASKTPGHAVSGGYDAVFFAGGHGTMWDFPQDESLQRLTREVYESGGVVAAVCHGPAALVNVTLSDGRYLVAGKEVAGFTNTEEAAVSLQDVVPFALESALVERGAQFQGAPNFTANVVVSGRLVTGQNPASARGVAEAVVGLLGR